MKMTAGEIITEARTAWNEPTAAFITAAEALRWVNLAQADFVRRTKCLRYSTEISTVNDQQEYPYPLSVAFMKVSQILCEGEALVPTTVDELDSMDPAWRHAIDGETGKPEAYYVTGEDDAQLGFWPCPDAVYTIKIYYTQEAPMISSTSGYPEIPEAYHDVLMLYVEQRGHRKNRDYKFAAEVQKEYLEQVQKAIIELTRLQPERRNILGGPEYRTKQQRPGWPRIPKGYGYVS
jgi:hypothetical protein